MSDQDPDRFSREEYAGTVGTFSLFVFVALLLIGAFVLALTWVVRG